MRQMQEDKTMTICRYSQSCWNYSLLACLIKKDNCDLVPKLKQLGDWLYEDCQADAVMQMEQDDLETIKRIRRMYKQDLTTRVEWEMYQ